jgi:hypothetical protein
MTVAALLLVARLVLAVVLAFAAVAKLIDRDGFRDTLADLRVPRPLVAPAAIGLPVLELVLAIGLLPARTAGAAAALAAALLAVFAVALGIAVARPEPVACRCFGALSHALVGRATVARTVALAALAAAVAVAGPAHPTISAVAWVGGLRTGEAVALAGVLVLALVAFAQAALSWQLLAQNGRLARRLEELESGAGAPREDLAARLVPGAPAVGDPAPDVALVDLAGARLRIAALLDGDRGLALVFTDPACSACEQVLDDVARGRRASGAAVVLVGGGDPVATAAKAQRHGIDGVLLDHDGSASLALGVAGVPGAVLIDRAGRIGCEPALGPDAVRALLARAAPALPALEVLAAGAQR